MSQPIRDLEIDPGTSLAQLLREMSLSGGFMGANLGDAFGLLMEMLRDDECLKILSFTGNVIATGTRGVIRDMVRRRIFDVIITTCGALDHDVARTYAEYERSSFDDDDYALRRDGYHRLGNVKIRFEDYGHLIEEFMQRVVTGKLSGRSVGSYEVAWSIGEHLNEKSFLYWCNVNRIPVIVPGILDGAVGYQLWLRGSQHKVALDLFRDQKLLNDMIWDTERAGALIVGGGISKHHTLWWAQFADGLKYAVYVTTADEYDGSLSGARPREAVSWKKIADDARHVFVKADATIALPILYLALISELK
ncbi:MAG: deoxyhypusine synthase [Aigarchaeota archaeon]|nr:deoxyhypusine synthase [Aigarchaeota archaeon]MDW8092941.1 deoxyhypusine synthase [Nitrososphaerota archaeon]